MWITSCKGVGDVLAGRLLRSSSQLSRASVTCLLGVELGVEVYFLVSRASVTCLLGMEQGVVFSLVSRASMTCLLGVEHGVDVFFGVKGVDDVLAGVEQGAYGGVYGDWAVDGFFRGFSAVFALLRVVPELSASF